MCFFATKDTVYYIPVDGRGNELRGDARVISLLPNGHADLSKLPDDRRETLETLGVPYRRGSRMITFPKHGSLFLEALVYSTNGYGPTFRYTLHPESN